MKRIQDIIRQRILVLDGAMGTMIQSYGLVEEDFRLPEMDYGGQMKGNNDVLCLTRPDVVTDIHRRYLQAGADIIETNTFSSQRISQTDYALEERARQMALAGARIARKAADEFSTAERPRFVAGSIGPTNKTCSMSPDVGDPARRDLTYDQLFEAYSEQVDALVEGGVDALLIETIFDSLNAKCAIDAALTVMEQRHTQLPIMLSVTVSDLSGRTLSGQTLDAFLASVSSYPIFSIGLNCSFGARQMVPFLRQLASRAPYYISCYPNAGLPNELGLYDETPQSMAPQVAAMMDEGLVNIVGGCCGTTDEFIRLFAQEAVGKRPHQPASRPEMLWLSGLEILEVASTPSTLGSAALLCKEPPRGEAFLPHLMQEYSLSSFLSPLSSLTTPLSSDFTVVGERCNVAGSRKFLRLVKEKKYDEAVAIARKQVEDGAMVVDVNMDDGLLDARSEMVNFLNMIAVEPDVAKVPVMIDSSHWPTVVAGLKCLQGKGIVNSISLKEGEEMFMSHARDVMRYGAAVVVMCFDEQGQATTFERRIEIAERAYNILTKKVGMNPFDIIFDPNVLAVATGMEEHDRYALDFIRATEWIRTHLPGAHVSGGVSNLSFSFRGNNYIREAMHAVFLHHAMKVGMDFGIVNPASRMNYEDIPKDRLMVIEDALLCRRPGASDRLVELATELSAAAAAAAAAPSPSPGEGLGRPSSFREDWGGLPVETRLKEALVRGVSDTLEADLKEALTKYPRAVDIIEGPLMAGMNRVGELFGAGKMFLPQVVKTARTMKQAVSILQPYIDAGIVGRSALPLGLSKNTSERSNISRETQEKPGASGKAGKILLATVKGDVHDIGKNIVAVVMACNGFEVVDMGVMVPASQIVKKAIEEKVDMIGLSGLITPSLEEMVNVARELRQAGLDVPIMIGGATTSELHVALKIAPVYGGPVVWMKDASQNALMAARLTGDEAAVVQELNSKYDRLRHDYQSQHPELVTIEEARQHKPKLFGCCPACDS